jgi:hypothetical protein
MKSIEELYADARARAVEMEARYDRLTLDVKRLQEERDQLAVAIKTISGIIKDLGY